MTTVPLSNPERAGDARSRTVSHRVGPSRWAARSRRFAGLVVAISLAVQFTQPAPGRATAPRVPNGEVAGPFTVVGPDGADGYLVVPQRPSPVRQFLGWIIGQPVDAMADAERAILEARGQVVERLDAAGILVADLEVDEVAALVASGAVEQVMLNVIVRHDTRVARESQPASWGLGVVDRDYRSAGLDLSYRYTTDGRDVDIYIVDSGLKLPHPDFVGRIPAEPAGGWFRLSGDTVGPTSDCNGHGAHVAGTAAGNLSGVAKGANLIPVKVFPECSRTTSAANVIAGLQWILDRVPSGGLVRPAVVNLSLGGLLVDVFAYEDPDTGDPVFFTQRASSPYDAYITELIDAGFTVVAAAGNDSWPALWFAPANAVGALTVGSVGRFESAGNLGSVAGDAILPGSSPRFAMNIESTFSNFGPTVDIFAPGASIMSACADPNAFGVNQTNAGCSTVTVDGVSFAGIEIGGTSMAAPHVAGLAARLLGATFATTGEILEPSEVAAMITGGAIPVVRAVETDRAAPMVRLRLAGQDYDVPLADLRNPDGTANVIFTTTNKLINTLMLEPSGPTRVDAPVLVPCAGVVASTSRQLAEGGVGPLRWSTPMDVPSGYLTSSGIVSGTLSGSGPGDVVLGIEDAFGRAITGRFSPSLLPQGCTD